MKIKIEKSKSVASCANCNARNYESQFGGNDKLVDTIYEVKIGNMVNNLCPDCLAELIGKATVALATDRKEEGR